MQQKDYYASLGIGRGASADEIQRAYRKLARKYHPDVNQRAGAEDRFKEISEAYEVLRDPEKRKTYDRYGQVFTGGAGGVPPGFENVRFDFGGEGGFGSIFESFFSGGGGGRQSGGFGGAEDFFQQGRGRARDEQARLALTLEEAARGGERELTLSDPMSGRSQTHRVKLPPGVRPGQKIRLAGRGSGGGDLYLAVEIRPHPRFRLDGADLHVTVPVTPWEAALGGRVRVPTLDGPAKTVKVPAGGGRRIRLKGEGFPGRGGRGDLYAELKVVVPEKLSARERELFEELARVSSFRPH